MGEVVTLAVAAILIPVSARGELLYSQLPVRNFTALQVNNNHQIILILKIEREELKSEGNGLIS